MKDIKKRIVEADEATAEAVIREVEEDAKQKINKRLLGRRKKYATTPEVASELNMTIEEIKEFNAYSDGYNARGEALKAELFDKPVKEEPLEDVVEVKTGPEPEPAKPIDTKIVMQSKGE